VAWQLLVVVVPFLVLVGVFMWICVND